MHLDIASRIVVTLSENAAHPNQVSSERIGNNIENDFNRK